MTLGWVIFAIIKYVSQLETINKMGQKVANVQCYNCYAVLF